MYKRELVYPTMHCNHVSPDNCSVHCSLARPAGAVLPQPGGAELREAEDRVHRFRIGEGEQLGRRPGRGQGLVRLGSRKLRPRQEEEEATEKEK